MAASWKTQSKKDPTGRNRAKMPQAVAGKGSRDAHSDLALPFAHAEAGPFNF